MPSGTGVKETSVASRHLGNMKLLRTPLHAVSLSHTLRHVCNMYFTAALISPLAFMATWAHMVLIMSSIVIILLKRKRESGKKKPKKKTQTSSFIVTEHITDTIMDEGYGLSFLNQY